MPSNKELFNKEVKRITSLMKKLERKGYEFDEDLIPATPKRVTKQAIEKVKKIKKEDLISSSIRIDTETGEVTDFHSIKPSKAVSTKNVSRETLEQQSIVDYSQKAIKEAEIEEVKEPRETVEPVETTKDIEGQAKNFIGRNANKSLMSTPREIDVPIETVDDEYIPEISILDSLRDTLDDLYNFIISMINNLPEAKFILNNSHNRMVNFNLGEYKNIFHSVVDDYIARVGDEKAEEYYEKAIERISNDISKIAELIPSEDEQMLMGSIMKLLVSLNGGNSFSVNKLKNLEDRYGL